MPRMPDMEPGGMWWADNHTGGCPACGALILVESECAFREIAGEEED